MSTPFNYLIANDNGNHKIVTRTTNGTDVKDHAQRLSRETNQVYRMYSLVEVWSFNNGEDMDSTDYTANAGQQLEHELQQAEKMEIAIHERAK